MAKKNSGIQRQRIEKANQKANRRKAGKRKLSEEKDARRYAILLEAPRGWEKTVKRGAGGVVIEVRFHRL